MFNFLHGAFWGVISLCIVALVAGDIAEKACLEVTKAKSCDLEWVAK